MRSPTAAAIGIVWLAVGAVGAAGYMTHGDMGVFAGACLVALMVTFVIGLVG